MTDPHLTSLLHGLGLAVEFTTGNGTRLTDAASREYLDFAGAYGALPLGHNPPEIWAAIEGVRDRAEPSLVQPSLPGAATQLARVLGTLSGLPHAFFTNSGAESVEAAIKLVRAATGRQLIVSAADSFHGKTLGALSATGRARYQTPFGAPAPGFVTVPFGSTAALRELFAARGAEIAAFLVEPVQGEGGIVPAPPGYLALARQLCTTYGAKLVFDEVQTGLGRTGRMFAGLAPDSTPDVLTVAKALGGGIVPAGAVLYGPDCLTEEFSLRHTSTFGGNAFCARIALATLDLLTADDQVLIRQAAARGDLLRAGLHRLQKRHPELITDVRGAGLLLGVEFTADPGAFPRQGMFRALAESEALVAHVCGRLLNEHGIRVAPAYFAARVLRVEPPLNVSEEDCQTFLAALADTLDLIAEGASGTYFTHLSGSSANLPVTGDDRVPGPGLSEPRWAFLGHPTDPASYQDFDPALGLAADEVRALFDRMASARSIDTPAAMFVGGCRVRTDDGRSSYGEIFALPDDARALLDMPTSRSVDLIGRAVREAAARGAQLVGLGAYTSIVTGNATRLGPLPIPVTTGNAYTAASAVDGLLEMARRRGVDPASATCAVLGAAGSIGRAMTLLLADEVGKLLLVGNPRTASRKLAALAELTGATHTDAADAVARADLVVAATSTPSAVIEPDWVKQNAIICDVAQPANVDPELTQRRPDVTVFAGGLVDLPGRRPLGLSLGLPPGVSYACTAETMIIAGSPGAPLSVGDQLALPHLSALRAAGRRLGFRLHLPDGQGRSLT